MGYDDDYLDQYGNPGREWERWPEDAPPIDHTGRCLCGDYAGGSTRDKRGFPMCWQCQQRRPEDIWRPAEAS